MEKTPTTDTEAALLTIQELSRRSNISVSTLHRWRAQRRIVALQPAGKGGKLLFRPDAVERCLARNTPVTKEAATKASLSPKEPSSGQTPDWMNSTTIQEEEIENDT